MLPREITFILEQILKLINVYSPATGTKKVRFHSSTKKTTTKECLNYHTHMLISHASKVMLKILQARLQQYMNQDIPDVRGGFRKGRGTRDQMADIRWIIDN